MESETKISHVSRNKDMISLSDAGKKSRKRRREKCPLDFTTWRSLVLLINFFSGRMKGKGEL